MDRLRVYLDNCCFNRPYDDQSQIKVQLEAQAKLFIQERIKENEYILIWSYILEYENNQNPYFLRKNEIIEWKKLADIIIKPCNEILERAQGFEKYNIKLKDAIHLSCAIQAQADYFFTTDIALIKKNVNFNNIKILNPLRFIELLEV